MFISFFIISYWMKQSSSAVYRNRTACSQLIDCLFYTMKLAKRRKWPFWFNSWRSRSKPILHHRRDKIQIQLSPSSCIACYSCWCWSMALATFYCTSYRLLLLRLGSSLHRSNYKSTILEVYRHLKMLQLSGNVTYPSLQRGWWRRRDR